MIRRYWLCYYLGPATPVRNYEISKMRVLYVSGNKPRQHPKGWIGQVVRLLHRKPGGAMDSAQNMILMMRMEENLTTIKIKTWASRTVSGWLYERVGGNQVHIITSTIIRDRVWWKGKITVLHWWFSLMGGKFEPWVITLDVMSPSGYMRGSFFEKRDISLVGLPRIY